MAGSVRGAPLTAPGTTERGRQPPLAALAGVTALAGAAALVWADVAASGPLAALDAPLLSAVTDLRAPGPTAVVRGVSELGGGWGRSAVAAVVVLALALPSPRPATAPVAGHGSKPGPGSAHGSASGRWRPLAAVAGALALTPLVNDGLKRLTGRARPPLEQALSDPGGLSFPSGHAMSTAALAVVLAWLVLGRAGAAGRPSTGVGRAAVVATALGWALAVGASRVYLGVHWPTDVIAGWAAGAALGWALVLLAGLRQRSPSAPPRYW